MKSTKLKTKQEKGITLMALIVTIVILLILATVAINSIQNDGIISHASNVTNQYNESVKNEQGILEGYLNYLDSSNGNSAEIELLERYILGAEKTGRLITEIMDMQSGSFINDTETKDIDESEDVTLLTILDADESNKMFFYIRYGNKAFKILIDFSTGNTEGLSLMYEPKGREGDVIEGGTYDGWIILTDRNELVEIVSPDSIGKLYLGSNDTSATTDLSGDDTVDRNDTAILSYNNAITRINNYCKEVMGIENVRSVGGTNNSAPAYHSTNYDSWGEDIPVDVASGDMQYELDLAKLAYFNKIETTNTYWVASRHIFAGSGGSVSFGVHNVNGGAMLTIIFWQVDSKGNVDYRANGAQAVRPVVINPSGI